MNEQIDEILDELEVKKRWSNPKPFIGDKQIISIAGKKKAKAKLQRLIVEARMDEMDYWGEYLPRFDWDKRIARLTRELEEENE